MRVTDPIAMLLCVAGMAIVGSSVSISQLLLDFPILTGQAIRYALAAAVLVAVLHRFPPPPVASAEPARAAPGPAPAARVWTRLARRTGWVPPDRRELGVLVALAATGLAGFNVCVLLALRHADPAAVGTLIGVSPLGLALIGPLSRGARPVPRLIVAAAIVVAGTVVVHGSGRASAAGFIAAGGALGCEIAFSLLAALVLPRLGAVRVTAYSCALAVPLLLAAALPAGELPRWRAPTPVEAATLAYLAGFMTVVAFLAWFTGLRRLGVERAGMITGVLPIAALVTAAVQAGRTPLPGQLVGVLAVAAGLAVGLTATPGRSRRRAGPTAVEVSGGGAAAP